MNETEQLQELKDRLIMLGAPEAELDTIINDVNEIVIQRTIKDYIEHINNPEITHAIQGLSGPELVEYVKNNSSKFPPFPEQKLKDIAERTWREYFELIEKE